MAKEPADTLPRQCLDMLRRDGPCSHLDLWGKLGRAQNLPAEVYRAAINHPDIVADRSGDVLTFRLRSKK